MVQNIVRVDDEMRDWLEEIINENCLLTLNSDKPWTEEKASSQTRDPWPHRIKDTRRDAISSETGKTPPFWQKQTWCAE